jgi:ribosomal protein S18 acetylase RimI-like enzyme
LLALTLAHPTAERLEAVCIWYRTDSSSRLLGYQSKGVLIGCLGLELSHPGDAIIRAIAVAPFARRKGIGSHLLQQSIATFSLTRLVAKTDRDAVQFYRRCGFTIASLGERYPGVERFLCSWARE